MVEETDIDLRPNRVFSYMADSGDALKGALVRNSLNQLFAEGSETLSRG